MNITVNVTKENRYELFIRFLNPILKLTDTEVRILAVFLGILETNKKTSREKVCKKMFSSEMRKRIRESLSISEPSFNNYLSSLKKKKLIVEKEYGYDLNEKIVIDDSLTINFKLK